ncbi:TonB-dependent receptor [Pareuzebyella sediminis]|uniref:TonB-dependent receptor n=1 Tax=Pareuzebyella sediminis TaxID=2607998 RepID=UPI0011EC905E|nr:TonB-dependent receptor [Pareuzebyella sediminis]
MRFFFVLMSIYVLHPSLKAQNRIQVAGTIFDAATKEPLKEAKVSIEGLKIVAYTELNGNFQVERPTQGEYILQVSQNDFNTKRIPISGGATLLNLGIIYLERDITLEQTNNLVTLTDAQLLDDEVSSNSLALLQATRDVFLNRAAFDFGQAFFRVRGYDSQNSTVSINGIPMNKFHDGRPQWNNWGGLNDVTRNQQFTNGLEASDFTFGGIMGNTNIDTRPSGLRSGTRLSASVSNRTYAGRLMATYNSGLQKNRLAYAVSGSRRWAEHGYIDGTLYDAFSLFGAIEYKLNKNHGINLTGLIASNRRGRSSAISEEVVEMVGKRYNPYWGEQDGRVRNARERTIEEPFFTFNHYYKTDRFRLNSGIAYQFGNFYKSRLGYYNAPNPDPTYYRYLPSFYINSPIGANFMSAASSSEGFREDPQLKWANIYRANSGVEAAYVLSDDRTDDRQITLNTIGNFYVNHNFQVDFGLTFRSLRSDNFSKIEDLFGADYHSDVDPFSDTLNDLKGPINKKEGDMFNYYYRLETSATTGFVQLRYDRSNFNVFVSGALAEMEYGRNGKFQNERFLNTSYGKSEKLRFLDYGVKSGFTYMLTGRHWLKGHGAILTRPPVLQNVFINPRENNLVLPELESERITSFDFNYFLRLPKLTGRVTGYYTRFQRMTDVNFFFVDSGVGSDFVQEVLTDLDKLHKGLEIGLEYQLSSMVKLNVVAGVGTYLYASDPNVIINFDTVDAEEDLINLEGNIDLGTAKIKNYKLGQGPQQAYAFGIEYRDPKYWWVAMTTNYLTDNYANISTIKRTESFLIDPETGTFFPDATDEYVNQLLKQQPLESFYLLNLVGGKSWLRKGKYMSIFLSINNLFDETFRTGGYEQSRTGNFGQLRHDNLSGKPSFAPKYWYGYGRTFFVNVAYSF